MSLQRVRFLLLVLTCFVSKQKLHSQILLISEGAQWKYTTNAPNGNVAWYIPQFDDSSWSAGLARFGYGNGDEQTALPAGDFLTAYFRKSFAVQGATSLSGILLKVKRDDGIVVYVNGIERFRSNMPTGNVTAQTPASDIAMNDGSGWIYCQLPMGIFHEGLNCIAAEVHNIAANDDDFCFDAALEATQLDSLSPIPVAFSPIPNSSNVHPQSACSIAFNETIRLHVGKASLSTEGNTIYSIDLPAGVLISTNSSLILPFPVLPSGTLLTVDILPNSISDLAGNFISDTLRWNFRTSCETIGCFDAVVPQIQTANLRIPASHRFQVLKQSGDLMHDSIVYPDNPDFTAFLPPTGSEMPLLCVNHEGNPIGQVSISSLALNDSLLWVMQQSSLVDFSLLGGTIRNCSGAITPWGTMLSGEEVRHVMGDSTGDGYQDAGWLVEIDPQNREICQYNTGSPQKLWAMGRMAHENAAISSHDRRTVYYGEDMADGCLYKFIADAPENLSSGNLFVLKLDSSLSGGIPSASGGVWIQVPNTTIEERNTTFQLALQLGGTMFNGIEDVEIAPDGRVYFASKNFGRVYRFRDEGTAIREFEVYVGGMAYPIVSNNDTLMENWGYGNDNLAFDSDGNLWVLQDGDRNHIWLVRNGHSQTAPRVTLFAGTPAGCEPTGITFSADYRYMFLSIQHPDTANTAQQDASGKWIQFNRSSTLVIARSEYLGVQPDDTLQTSSIERNVVSVRAMPQPCFETVTLELTSPEEQEVELLQYALTGNLLASRKINLVKGLQRIETIVPPDQAISILSLRGRNINTTLKIMSIQP